MTVALLKSAVLLINVLFGLYIFIVLLRFLTGFSRTDPYNPISQLLLKLTDRPLTFLHQFIPPVPPFNFAILIFLYLLELIKHLLLLLIHTAGTYSYGSIYAQLFIWPIGSLLDLTLKIYFWSILFTIIFSWLMLFNLVRLDPNNPVYTFLSNLVDPILAPFQKIIPAINGIDFTPILALLLLQVIGFFVQLLPYPNW